MLIDNHTIPLLLKFPPAGNLLGNEFTVIVVINSMGCLLSICGLEAHCKRFDSRIIQQGVTANDPEILNCPFPADGRL
jgi:hypothetical protein